MRKRKRDELDFYELELLKEIWAMFHALNTSYEQLEDKTGIVKEFIRFDGFDANDPYESKLHDHSGFIDSHAKRLPFYKRLLEHWRDSRDRKNLTREDILRIVDGVTIRHAESGGRWHS